jgi:hypothetical protein
MALPPTSFNVRHIGQPVGHTPYTFWRAQLMSHSVMEAKHDDLRGKARGLPQPSPGSKAFRAIVMLRLTHKHPDSRCARKVHVDRSLLIQRPDRHELRIMVERTCSNSDLRKALSTKIREQTNREDGRKEK